MTKLFKKSLNVLVSVMILFVSASIRINAAPIINSEVSVTQLPKFVDVKTAQNKSCGLDENGTLYVWGQTFLNTVDWKAASAVPMPMLRHVQSVTTDGTSFYIIKQDKSLWVFPAASLNQYDVPSASGVKKANDVVEVKIGVGNVFVLKTDGSLWGWGKNWHQQLDMGGFSNGYDVPLKLLKNDVLDFSVTEYALFVVNKQHQLWSSGRNKYGQTGNPFPPTSNEPEGGAGGEYLVMNDVKAVSAAISHTLILKTDNSVWSLGDNSYGQLGNGTRNKSYVPIKITEQATSIATSDNRSAIIKLDGSLWTFGANAGQRLGDGTDADRLMPVKVLDNVSKFINFRYALTNDDKLIGWGANSDGFLGTGDTISPLQPVEIIDNVKTVTSSYNTTLVIKDDGSVYGWGDNTYGQVGLGYTSAAVVEPTLIAKQPTHQFNIIEQPNIKIDQGIIDGNNQSYFLIDSAKTLWGWGSNRNGELGDGTVLPRPMPVPIANDVASIIVYGSTNYLIKTDGSLWVLNQQKRIHEKVMENVVSIIPGGRFGNVLTSDDKVFELVGTTNPLVVSPVLKMENVKSFTGYANAIFAILNDQSLWSWGSNSNGMLGTGSTSDYKTVPEKVMDNVDAVDYLGGAIIASTTNNEIWSWGSNIYGRLGTGSTSANSLIPVKVMENVKSTYFAYSVGYLLTNDDTLWSWGNNNGMLGFNTTEAQINVPTKVMENVKSISNSNCSVAALKTDDSLMMWGCGSNYTSSKTPVSVATGVKQFVWNQVNTIVSAYIINTNNELYRVNSNYPNVTLTKLSDNVLNVGFNMFNEALSSTYFKDRMHVILEDHSLWYWKYNDINYTQPIKLAENVERFENDYIIDREGSVSRVTFPTSLNNLKEPKTEFLIDISRELLDISTESVSLNTLQKKILKLNYVPADYDGTILFKPASLTDIATVDVNGLITALKPGTLSVKITNSTETITYQQVQINITQNAYIKGVDNNGIYNHDVLIEFANAAVTLNGNAIDSGTWVSAEGSYNLKLTDNQNSTMEINFTIDKTAPEITLSNYPTGLTTSSIKVDATVSGGTIIGPTTYTFTDNGTFTFWASDTAGNLASRTVNINNISTKPSTIEHITVTSSTTTRFALNWDPSYVADPEFGPVIYKIFYRSALNNTWYYKTSTTNSYTFTGLSNTWYEFYVVAIDKSGRESTPSPIQNQFLEINKAPAIPSGFKITQQSNDKAVIEWLTAPDVNSDLKGYVISYQLVGSTAVINKTVDKSANRFELTGLLPGKSYYVKLRAYDELNQYSGYTSTLTIKTQMDVAPKPVTGLVSTIINDTSIGVKWIASNDLNLNLVEYVFEITDLSNADTVEYQSVGWNNTTALLTGLELGHNYSIRIKALDSTGLSSEYSLPITITTVPISNPEPVTGLRVTYQNTTKINLAWNPAVDVNQDVVKYTIYYTDYNDMMAWQPYDTTNTNSSGMPFWRFGWVIDGKTYWETRYWFWVEAIDSKGNRSIASERVLGTFVADAYPTTPTQLRVLRQGYSAVTLAWNPSTDANMNIKSYLVTYTKAGSTTVYTKVVSPTENGITITGLVNNAVYTFKVRALDTTSRYSGYSNAVSARPQSDVAPAKVTGLKTTHQGNGNITYTWTKASDNNLNVKEYIIAIQDTSIPDNTWVEYTVPVTTTAKTFEGLTNDKTYAVKIKAVDTTNLTSDYCLPVNGVPHVEAAPDQVNDLRVTYLSPNAVTLSWSVPNDDNLDLSSYVVAYGVDGNMTSTKTTNTNSVVITGLTNEVTYDFQVKAIDALNNASEYSTNVQGVPHLSAAPTAPSGLKLERQGNGLVELSWNPSTDINLNHKYYVITYIRSGYSTVYTVNVLPNVTKTTISRLVNGAVYTFKIRAVDTTNLYSVYANSVVAKPQADTAPTAIQAFKLDHQGDSTLTLSWLPSTDVNSNFLEYVVYLQDTTNPNNPWIEYHTTQTTLHITGLDNQTMYAVKMKAIDKTNLSTTMTPVIIGIPDVEQAPRPINNFKVAYQGSGKLSLLWDPVMDVNLDLVQYRLYYRTVGSLEWTAMVVYTNTVNLTGLANGVAIEAQLLAEDALGQQSGLTSIIIGQPQLDVAPTVSTLSMISKATGTVSLGWTPAVDLNLNLKQYEITYTRSGYSTTYKKIVGGGDNLTITGLVTGGTYTFRIRALDITGLYSSYSNSVVVKI